MGPEDLVEKTHIFEAIFTNFSSEKKTPLKISIYIKVSIQHMNMCQPDMVFKCTVSKPFEMRSKYKLKERICIESEKHET